MTRVYVGNLNPSILERELEAEFSKFGTLRSVWVARKPPGFAFVEFEDRRDAEDAMRRLDGYKSWRVEISRNRGPNWDRSGGGGGRGRDRDVGHRGASPPPRRSPDRRGSPSYDRRRRSPSYDRRSRSPPPRRDSPKRDRSRDRSRGRRSPSEEPRRSPSADRNGDDR